MATVFKEVSKITPNVTAYAVTVSQFAKQEKATMSLFDSCVDAAYTALNGCKDFAEFKLLRAGMVAECIKAGLDDKYSENKVSSHISAAKSKLDLVIPVEAASATRAKARAEAQTKNLTAAIISGVGADDAEKKLARLAKSDDKADKAIAAAVLKATQASAAARAATKLAEEKAKKFAEAMSIVADHYGLEVAKLTAMLEKATAKKAA